MRTTRRTGVAATAVLMMAGAAAAERQEPDTPGDVKRRVELLRPRIAEQARVLEELRRTLAEQEAALQTLRLQLEAALVPSVSPPTPALAQPRAQAPAQAPAPASAQAPASPPASPPLPPPRVAAIFEQPSVLTPPGRLTLEPSLQYAYASSNRVALVGYTVIPAVLVGLIDVREVKRSTVAAALTARYGLNLRLELEAKLPYVYRSDTSIAREVGQGRTDPEVFNASGRGIGDIELSARYQLNTPGPDGPYYVGSLRVKSRTGKDPFQVTTASGTLDPNGEGVQTELPTGSGFYALQPGLTVLLPSDPAVFFGSVSYLHNLRRRNVSSHTDQGLKPIGTVAPGGIFGFNFGMGLALNDRSSFSLGYDHSSVGRTRINGVVPVDSVRLQLGTLLLGYSYRLDSRRTVNVSLGAGLTRDTPDLSLTLRLPGSW